jgi:hypothetical protein
MLPCFFLTHMQTQTHTCTCTRTHQCSLILSFFLCVHGCVCVCVCVCFAFLVASLFSFLPLFLFFVGMFNRQKEVVSSARKGKLARQSNTPPTSQSRGMGIPAIVRSHGGLSQSLWQDFQGGTERSQSIRLQGHPGKRERKKGKWERKKK